MLDVGPQSIGVISDTEEGAEIRRACQWGFNSNFPSPSAKGVERILAAAEGKVLECCTAVLGLRLLSQHSDLVRLLSAFPSIACRGLSLLSACIDS